MLISSQRTICCLTRLLHANLFGKISFFILFFSMLTVGGCLSEKPVNQDHIDERILELAQKKTELQKRVEKLKDNYQTHTKKLKDLKIKKHRLKDEIERLETTRELKLSFDPNQGKNYYFLNVSFKSATHPANINSHKLEFHTNSNTIALEKISNGKMDYDSNENMHVGSWNYRVTKNQIRSLGRDHPIYYRLQFDEYQNADLLEYADRKKIRSFYSFLFQTDVNTSFVSRNAAVSERRRVKVIDVMDGDTFKAKDLSNFKTMTVRVLGIDCPETSRNSKCRRGFGPNGELNCDEQIPLGKKATEQAKHFMQSRRVTLITGVDGHETRGSYGRLLAYVDLNGRDLGTFLLNKGVCWDYGWKYPHPRQDRYERIQRPLP